MQTQPQGHHIGTANADRPKVSVTVQSGGPSDCSTCSIRTGTGLSLPTSMSITIRPERPGMNPTSRSGSERAAPTSATDAGLCCQRGWTGGLRDPTGRTITQWQASAKALALTLTSASFLLDMLGQCVLNCEAVTKPHFVAQQGREAPHFRTPSSPSTR